MNYYVNGGFIRGAAMPLFCYLIIKHCKDKQWIKRLEEFSSKYFTPSNISSSESISSKIPLNQSSAKVDVRRSIDMKEAGIINQINGYLDDHITNLQDLARKYRHIDNYHEICRIRELEAFRKYLNQLTSSNKNGVKQ